MSHQGPNRRAYAEGSVGEAAFQADHDGFRQSARYWQGVLARKADNGMKGGSIAMNRECFPRSKTREFLVCPWFPPKEKKRGTSTRSIRTPILISGYGRDATGEHPSWPCLCKFILFNGPNREGLVHNASVFPVSSGNLGQHPRPVLSLE
jgi:hypothetical protein